ALLGYDGRSVPVENTWPSLEDPLGPDGQMGLRRMGPGHSSNLGQELLDRVFRHLNLLETAYFGLRYLDHGNQTKRDGRAVEVGHVIGFRVLAVCDCRDCTGASDRVNTSIAVIDSNAVVWEQWLDPSKKIGKQLKVQKGDPSSDVHTLYFGVKFYAADPCKLIEEITSISFYRSFIRLCERRNASCRSKLSIVLFNWNVYGVVSVYTFCMQSEVEWWVIGGSGLLITLRISNKVQFILE
ncbi:Band 4.1-like protein 4A, partial [Eufriesea mexicana]